MNIPRAEYPRPQFVRKDWLTLNGPWTFELDPGNTAAERGRQNAAGFDRTIIVPFCPESELSGVGHKDIIKHLLYHKKLAIPADWAGKRILLHFGAVDYACEGYVNGKLCGRHSGGSISFYFDLTDFVKAGESCDFVLIVHDDVQSGIQPSGKQSIGYQSVDCQYTRVTGIWQSVWLEPVSEGYLETCRIVAGFDDGTFVFSPEFVTEKPGRKFRVRVLAAGKTVGSGSCAAVNGISVTVPLEERHPWSPADPFLYDVQYEVVETDGSILDAVTAYAGFRKIHIEGSKVFLNNQELFQRLVLDQGFYEDGIWTAPSDAALKRDIELAKAAGFNGARLHQKVFEERFHYWADKLGYLTWGEAPSWGLSFNWYCDPDTPRYWHGIFNFKKEWREIVRRDRNHPSIITWTPLNECWVLDAFSHSAHVREVKDAYRLVLTEIYDLTKSLDPTRPVNEASGYHHIKTDLWTVHLYCPTVEKMNEQLFPADAPVWHQPPWDEGYTGQPYFNDEFGGIMFIPPGRRKFAPNTWGYVKADSAEALCRQIGELVAFMEADPRLSGFCYTQLTDIEQEQNGIFNYDRTPKAPIETLYRVFHGNGR